MKTRLFSLITASLLLLSGCVTVTVDAPEEEEKSSNLQLEEVTLGESEPEEKSENPYEIYEKWAHTAEHFTPYSDGTDCVYTDSDYFQGHDLLSTLIVREDVREKADLKVYTPAYLANLEKKIADFSGKFFYAAKICHLKDDLDILGGEWAEDDLNKQEEECFKGLECFDRGEAIYIVNSGKVHGVEMDDDLNEFGDDQVSVFNRTATGGEVQPCKSELDADGNIVWTCFRHLCEYTDEGITEARYWSWTIDPEGNILSDKEIPCE
ncbi:hypothetical protein ACFL2V_03355 [Pseudomonadota bacterium]